MDRQRCARRVALQAPARSIGGHQPLRPLRCHAGHAALRFRGALRRCRIKLERIVPNTVASSPSRGVRARSLELFPPFCKIVGGPPPCGKRVPAAAYRRRSSAQDADCEPSGRIVRCHASMARWPYRRVPASARVGQCAARLPAVLASERRFGRRGAPRSESPRRTADAAERDLSSRKRKGRRRVRVRCWTKRVEHRRAFEQPVRAPPRLHARIKPGWRPRARQCSLLGLRHGARLRPEGNKADVDANRGVLIEDAAPRTNAAQRRWP